MLDEHRDLDRALMASLYFPNSQESEFKVQPVLAANINRPQFRVQQALVVHSQMILARPIVVEQYIKPPAYLLPHYCCS